MESNKQSAEKIPVNTSATGQLSPLNAPLNAPEDVIPMGNAAATKLTDRPADEKAPGTPSTPALSATPTVKSEPPVFKNKKPLLLTTILAVLIVILVGGGIYGVYDWQQNKVTKLNTQVSSLNNQVASLESRLNDATSATITAGPSTSSTQYLFKIPELGIQLTVPSILADLDYAANAAHTSVNLSSLTLSTLDSSCLPNASSDSNLGDISKVVGQFKSSSSSTVTLVKQYSTYYIGYTKPTGNCSTDPEIDSLASSLVTDLQTTFSSIEVSSS